jgi:hypothetical protein
VKTRNQKTKKKPFSLKKKKKDIKKALLSGLAGTKYF